ncbi:MAG: quinone oxidoreductase [Pseudomonadota bacterium]
MANAVRVHTPGGPEVLQYENYEPGSPGDGEVRLEQHAVGLNFIDVYHRTGLYPIADKPFVLGLEAAGVVTELGANVSGLAVGDRVAYAAVPIGAYCDERIIPAHRLVKLPEQISFETGAAMMLQGMTVQYLIRSTYHVKAGDTVLFHAAAGGVGAIACQWLNHLGATVIGTVGSAEKAALAKANGCHHTVLYREENLVDAVAEITGGKGVPVVYDSVGKDTYEASLDCLSPLGLFVSFGSASGPVESVSPAVLAAKGSLFFTRPTLMTYTADNNDLQVSAKDLFDVVGSGAVKISVDQTYALKDARQAHEDLEARKTTGSTVFTL